MSQFFDSATDWLRGLSQNAFRVPDAALQVDAGWFAGMSIRPAEFSGQLAALQEGIRRDMDRQMPEPAQIVLKRTA
ncbi:MAG: hypothetical protein KGN84_20095 [Acidobacteriota bacterium]|nr:hypothetical protein [Acidobacteriota bacterium]